MSIVASPTLSSDVRHKATGLLRQLYDAYSNDKTANSAKPGDPPIPLESSTGKGKGLAATAAARASTSNPDSTVPEFTHPDPSHINSSTQAEARSLEMELDTQHLDDRVEDTPVSTDEVLRVHGIYMNQRRHLEVRVDGMGRLVLWDSDEGKVWGS